MKRFYITALAVCAIAIPACFAQATTTAPKLKGSYVLAEEGTGPTGQDVAALATLMIADNGSVVGKKFTASGQRVQQQDFQGSFTSDADGSGTLLLSTSSTDEDGNTATTTESYRLLITPDGSVNALRTTSGYFTIAKLSPAATANTLKGTYSFAETREGRPFARIVQLKVDAGAATGFQILGSQNTNGTLALKGTTQAVTDGFGTLALSSSSTNEDGEVTSNTENFVFLSTMSGVKMLRTDSGQSGIIDLSH